MNWNQSIPALAVVAILSSCGSPQAGRRLAATTAGDHLTTGDELAANPDELRHDLLLQLQDRTGRFINQIDGHISVMLQDPTYSPAQRTWLRTLRLDGIQGVLWAVQQQDVMDSEIETLFFSKLLHTLKVAQAKSRFEASQVAAIDTLLASLEAIYWNPVAATLGDWGVRLSEASESFATERPDTPSIAFVSSDLYVVADDQAHRQLSGMFGLDARLEAAAKGIGYLQETADRAVFLAEFMPLLMTRYAESATANMLDAFTAPNGGPLTAIQTHIDHSIRKLAKSLAEQRDMLAATLQTASESLSASLEDLNTNLGDHVKSIETTVTVQLHTLATRLESMEQSAAVLSSGVKALEGEVDDLAIAVEQLEQTVASMPEQVVKTLAQPSPETADALVALESRLTGYVALLIIGTVAATMIGTLLTVFLAAKLRRNPESDQAA